jgi:hypothetical protein
MVCEGWGGGGELGRLLVVGLVPLYCCIPNTHMPMYGFHSPQPAAVPLVVSTPAAFCHQDTLPLGHFVTQTTPPACCRQDTWITYPLLLCHLTGAYRGPRCGDTLGLRASRTLQNWT